MVPRRGGAALRETLETWIYKRDSAISGPRVDTTAEGIAYLKPAAVILSKAKYQRAKDEIDFERALPKLPASDHGLPCGMPTWP